MPDADLPEGADEGSVVTVETDGATWPVVELDREETQRRRSGLAERLRALKGRSSRGGFGGSG